MKDIAKIVLVDTPAVGTDEAIARILALPALTRARVTVLAAVGHVPSLAPGSDLDIEQLLLEEHRRSVSELAGQLKAKGVETTVKVRVGIPFVEIVREVLETGADLLIKVSESEHRERTKFGSLDLHLLRKCPRPVLITRPRERTPYRRVFAAIDPAGDRTDRDKELDANIVRWSAAIAQEDGAKLTILHAWELVGESMLTYGFGRVRPEELRRERETARLQHQRRVEVFMKEQDLSDIDHAVEVVKGPPAQIIPDLVERGRGDLLVMGTVGRTGIKGFFIGNTAESVIRRIECAVLALKPDGFVSPVELE